jgi:environmental stress-induced protein Ves
MFIAREAAYRAVPWKNGGGITREIFREPLEPAPFDWRLSLATVDAPGPFSAFDGYHRTLLLVHGAGVELDFGQHGRARLSTIGQRVSFAGDWQTECTLLDGRSIDLNLIVANERMCSQSDSLQLRQAQIVQAHDWPERLICCISGAIRLTNSSGCSEELHSVDVARCSPADGDVICAPLGNIPANVFLAALAPAAAG